MRSWLHIHWKNIKLEPGLWRPPQSSPWRPRPAPPTGPSSRGQWAARSARTRSARDPGPSPAHKGLSTQAVQEDVKSGTRFPQPLTGRAADSLSCSEGAVSPPPVLTGSQGLARDTASVPTPQRRASGPQQVRGRHHSTPRGSWCQHGWSVGTASAEGASPGHGVVRVSQMKGHKAQRGKSQLLTAASASGKLRGCRVLKERQFLLSKIFLFVRSLLAALGLHAGCGLSAVCRAGAALCCHGFSGRGAQVPGRGPRCPAAHGILQTRGRTHGPCALRR